MKALHANNNLRWFLTLMCSMACLSFLTYNYSTSGLSATWFVVFIVGVTCTLHLFSLYKQQSRQIIQVIKALANGDSTLGLSAQHPLNQYFHDVKQQVQSSRLKAEQQAQFLQTLLVHVDLAIIVSDDSGNVIESNPAASRLLGKSITTLNELKEVGELILETDSNRKFTAPWKIGDHEDTLSIQVTTAQIQGNLRLIITMQSIHEELTAKEQQAYKRLTKVLTHEVANSITPLASIAETCQNLLPDTLNFANQENKDDLQLALKTISSRTQHLEEFIDSFQSISRLPSPTREPQDLHLLIEDIAILFKQQLTVQNITLTIKIKDQSLVMLDKSQIEQVMINLVKNSIDSLKTMQESPAADKKAIEITVGQNNAHQVYVDVADSGPGVPEHVIDVMFVPFYTTKQEGSGIGLSLSRQIMNNHGGDLVYIKQEKGSCFRCLYG